MINDIIIFSEPNDQSTNDVLGWLYHTGNNVIRLNPTDTIQFKSIDLTSKSKKVDLIVNHNIHFSITDKDQLGTWYRRGELLFHYESLRTELFERNIQQEKQTLEHFLNIFFRKDNYINKQEDNGINKMEVLLYASDIGLNIPDTIIATNKSQLLSFFEKHPQCITKAISELGSVAFIKNQQVAFNSYSNLVSIDDISDDETFMPSLFQEYIPKKYEIRSFYLNGIFRSMAIFSQQNSKTQIDFRNYDNERPNRCIPYQLPHWYERKLDKLMRKMNINCGSIDVLRCTDNQYYFLEVNPIGQFQWLSKNCNYYIEKLIADTLINKRNE